MYYALTCKVPFLWKTRWYSFLGEENSILTRCSLFLGIEEIRLDSPWWKNYPCIEVPTFDMIFMTPIPLHLESLKIGQRISPMNSEHLTHEEGEIFFWDDVFWRRRNGLQDGMSRYRKASWREREERVGGDCSGHIWAVATFLIITDTEYSITESFIGQTQTDMILVMSLASSVNWVKWFPFSKPQFSHLQNGDIKSVTLWESQLTSHQKPHKIQLDHISQPLLQFSVAIWLSSSHRNIGSSAKCCFHLKLLQSALSPFSTCLPVSARNSEAQSMEEPQDRSNLGSESLHGGEADID